MVRRAGMRVEMLVDSWQVAESAVRPEVFS